MNQIQARAPGFWRSYAALSIRALRSLPRDSEAVIPALFIPVFFFLVNVGTFEAIFTNGDVGFNYRAFQLPVAILFAVTGLSRAYALVLDVQGGYFDRLALTPANRLALLLGLMTADLMLATIVSIPVFVMGLIFGVWFVTGVLGLLAFIGIALLWVLAFNGIAYGLALKTGNPAVVNLTFIIFFPVIFLSTVFVPIEATTSWFRAVATYNPATYLLDGLRSLLLEGWIFGDLWRALLSIAIVGVFTLSFAMWGLRSRLRRR